MRVTQRAIAETSLLGLYRNQERISNLQQQMTSGKAISTPSDSPTGTNQAMQIRKDASAVAQQARNISDGKGWLEAADSALDSMLSQVRRVRDLTVQGLNTGTASDAAREAIRTEVASLRSSLIGLANQTIGNKPIFGGATTGTRAYDADGTFVGVGGTSVDGGGVVTDLTVPLTRRVSDSEVIRVELTGPEAFGDQRTGRDLFAIIGDIADHVMTAGTDSTDLRADLAALDTAFDRLLTSAADIGSRAARLERAEQVNLDLQLTLKSQLAEVEEIDLPRTIMELSLSKTGYEAALSATSQVIQRSLVDYLR